MMEIAEELGGAEKVTVAELVNSSPFALVESMINEMAKWPGREKRSCSLS